MIWSSWRGLGRAPSPIAAAPLGLLVTPVLGAAIGGVAVLVSDRGVADRPALAALIRLAGIAVNRARRRQLRAVPQLTRELLRGVRAGRRARNARLLVSPPYVV